LILVVLPVLIQLFSRRSRAAASIDTALAPEEWPDVDVDASVDVER
jgi:hypothetical protein